MSERRTTDTGDHMVACPHCGNPVAPDSVICGLCLQPLRGRMAAGEAAMAARETVRREADASSHRRRLGWAVASLLVVGLVAYWLWFRPPPKPPVAVNPTRAMEPATSAPDRWPGPGGDNAQHRVTAAPAHLDGQEQWRHTVDAPLTTDVIVGDRLLYFGITAAALIALDRTDGHEVWRVPVPGQLDAAPILAGDRLYVTRRDGSVSALDAATGATIWTAGRGPAYFAPAVVAGGVVYALALGQVSAFDAQTGAVLWTHQLDSRVSATAAPAVLGDRLLVASYRRGVLLDLTGQQLYFYSLPSADHLTIVGDLGVIVAGDRTIGFGLEQRRPWWDGIRTAWAELWLFGLAPAPPDQPRRWVGPADPGSYAPAVAGDTLVIATADGIVRGLDLRNGSPRWEVKAAAVTAPPVMTASGLLLLESDALVLLDPKNGAELSRRPLPGTHLTGGTVTTAATYLVSDRQTLIAVR